MLDTTQQQTEAQKPWQDIMFTLATELCGEDGFAALVTMMGVRLIYPLDAEEGKHLGGFAFKYSPKLTAYSNKSNMARIFANVDGTRTMVWFRYNRAKDELTQVDIAEGITPDKMEETWWKHTECAVRLPFFIDACRYKFSLGQTVCTNGANETFTQEEMRKHLARHQSGDWGDICEEDKAANEAGLKDKENPGRLMSVYNLDKGRVMWIITERDRSVTTILLPDEY